MHRFETTLTDSAEPSTRPDMDAEFTRGAPAHGDLAAGLCTHVLVADAHGTFATGMSQSSGPAAGTAGDFASAARSPASVSATGDFATGMRVRDRARMRPGGGGRSRADIEREETRWATA